MKTDVIFRKYRNGSLLALFPHDVGIINGEVICYIPDKKHSKYNYINYSDCISETKPATKIEYSNLKEQLEKNAGYKFNVIQKPDYKKYCISFALRV